MAGQNDFLIFDENKDNMLTQELYQEDTDRTDGFQTGVARSNVNNKVLHQTSMMCHAIGELAKDNDFFVSDESSVDELKSAIGSLFNAPDKVSKSGDTMTGTLILERGLKSKTGLDISADDVIKGEAPASSNYLGIRFNDSVGEGTWQDTRLALVECSVTPDNSTALTLGVYKNEAGSTSLSCIKVGYDNAGNSYATAPTPASGDNSGKIATTAYCVNMRCTTKATTTSSASTTRPAWVVQNYRNGTSWYRVWSDGWIEQGGQTSNRTSNGALTIKFLKSFSDTNYVPVISNFQSGGIAQESDSIQSKTKSQMVVFGWEGRATTWYACGY